MPVQFPTENYPRGGMVQELFDSPLNAVMRGFQSHDMSEMRNKALQDAQELIRQRQLENQVKEYEAANAQAKMHDPDYIQSGIRGYKAQNELQELAAQLSRETKSGQIKRTNIENANATSLGELQQRLYELKKRNVLGEGQPQPSTGGSIGLPIAGKPGGTQLMNANNSPLQRQAPLRNGGINQGNPEYEATMQALVDQPELRTALIKGDQKQDSAEYMQMLKLMQAMQIAQARHSGAAGDPKTAEHALMRDIARKEALGEYTHEEAQEERSKVFNRKTEKTLQQGVAAQVNSNGTIELTNKKPSDGYVPNTGKPKIRGAGTREDPIKLD